MSLEVQSVLHQERKEFFLRKFARLNTLHTDRLALLRINCIVIMLFIGLTVKLVWLVSFVFILLPVRFCGKQRFI